MRKHKQERRRPQERETQPRPAQTGFMTEAEKWKLLVERAAARGVKLPEGK